ncbi:PIN domain-containing protein [Kamptonema cortianum]|nr:PIN domain-containing protein [Kamptonema cortianum]
MTLLFDTDFLVGCLDQKHEFHEHCFPWLVKCAEKRVNGVISTHTLAELYATLTALSFRNSLSPRDVSSLIDSSVCPYFELMALTAQDYKNVIRRLSEEGLSSGAIYDALIGESALKARVRAIATFNHKDFNRFSWLKAAGIEIGI